MADSLTATQSIQETNAAYLAQMKADKTATSAPQQPGASGFAAELQSIQKYDLPAPTPLARAGQTQPVGQASLSKTTNISQKSAVVEEAEGGEVSGAEPKIARSARMACAEQATHVSHQDDDFGVDDLVDFLNPLQHIPLVGTLYRELTGDTIKPEVQVAGSVIFGAATGSILVSAVSGIASALIEQETGKEPLVQVADALFGDTVQTGSTLTEDKVIADGAGAPVEVAQASGTAEPSAQSTDVGSAAGNAIKVAQAVDNDQIAAPVVAVADAQQAATKVQHKDVSPALAASSGLAGATRVGNIIYASPTMKSAAKIASATRVGTNATTPPAASPTLASADTGSATRAKLDNNTLGTLIHEQAKARDAGQQLPPELVQDMMLMAMDKYKASHVASASVETGTAVQ